MRLVVVLGCATALMAQTQRYSSNPSGPGPKSGPAKHVKNALDYTPDGDFLRRAAEDNAFAIEYAVWSRAHGKSEAVRGTATELLAQETKLGDDLRKLAVHKHVLLREKINDRDAAERSRIDSIHSGDTDQSFVEQLLRRYDQEMVGFQKEADSVADPDIRAFASAGVGTLEKHRKLMEALVGKIK